MSEPGPVPASPLEQAPIVDVHPREGATEAACFNCGDVDRIHICNGEQYRCSECCDDTEAGTGTCQRFIARERAGTLLVNRRAVPTGWGDTDRWPVDRDVVDIGRADRGDAVLTNTEPRDPGWLGNPFKLDESGGVYSRQESVRKYRSVFYRLADERPEFRDAVLELQGTILLGWCVPKLCHGDVVLEWLDEHGDG